MAAPRAASRRAARDNLRTAYEADVSAWAIEQARHLRMGAWAELDIGPLADEIEALARSERNALTNALRVILLHLLKWDHQPARRTRSWVTSVRTQRLSVLEQLEDSPSLAPQVDRLTVRAYRSARIQAPGETKLEESRFPDECPYPFDAIMTRELAWPPDPEARPPSPRKR